MKKIFVISVMILLITLFLVKLAPAQNMPLPNINVAVSEAKSPQDVAMTLQILLLLTVLSLAPAILVMITSFTRIVIVLSFLRQAVGTQQLPPNQIIIGLALFLTVFIMTPVWQQINVQALQPYLAKEVSQEKAFTSALEPIRRFMFAQTREKDLALFVHLSKAKRPRNSSEVSTTILIPAFIISELKTAFEMGFLLFVPFLIIDVVIASVLLSMGMMMLPPVMISLPFKLLLFVLVDGWYLVVGSVARSFIRF